MFQVLIYIPPCKTIDSVITIVFMYKPLTKASMSHEELFSSRSMVINTLSFNHLGFVFFIYEMALSILKGLLQGYVQSLFDEVKTVLVVISLLVMNSRFCSKGISMFPKRVLNLVAFIFFF